MKEEEIHRRMIKECEALGGRIDYKLRKIRESIEHLSFVIRGMRTQGEFRNVIEYFIKLKDGPEHIISINEGAWVKMGPSHRRGADNTPADTVRVFEAHDLIEPIMVFNDVSYFKKV